LVASKSSSLAANADESRTDESSPTSRTNSAAATGAAPPPGLGGRGDKQQEPPAAETAALAMMDLERLKSATTTTAPKTATEAELTLSVVKPMQSDFHFFAQAVRDRLRLDAEEEVQSSLLSVKASPMCDDPHHRVYLVNTNLNARLMKAWEDLRGEDREVYIKKEEEDRKRFMEEDEVASRHCATLTARVKSPGEAAGGGGGGGVASKEASPGRRKGKGRNRSARAGHEDCDGEYDDGEGDSDLRIQASDSQDDYDPYSPTNEEKEAKRSPGDAEVDDQSPSKKNRVDGEV
jgi:hypothetical protein